jgi:hypothetical protein
MMPYLPHKIYRGIRSVLDGSISHESLCRLVFAISASSVVVWTMRIFGGESHHASVLAAECGMASWAVMMVILTFAGFGRKAPETPETDPPRRDDDYRGGPTDFSRHSSRP